MNYVISSLNNDNMLARIKDIRNIIKIKECMLNIKICYSYVIGGHCVSSMVFNVMLL